MGNIWRIYLNDWRNLFKVPVAVLLVAALVVLPSVYDWVNVAAVWDPYSNTSGIRIAVSSLDQGAEVKGKSFNIGEEVLASLQSNHSLGWTFVAPEAAVAGVRRGDYYASILIPADFSQRMAGILEGRLIKPEVQYTVNEKINAIAPKITNKGASSITAQISEKFTETLSSTVLSALQEADETFQSELPVIRRVEQGLFQLEENLPEIEKAGRLVLKLQQDWPDISASASRLIQLQDKLPLAEQAGAAAELLDEHWSQISASAALLQKLEGHLPELKQAAGLVAELDSRFSDVETVMEKASGRLAEAERIVDAAAQALPQADRLVEAGGGFGRELEQFLADSSTAFTAVTQAVRQNLYLLQQTADASAQLAGQMLADSAGADAVQAEDEQGSSGSPAAEAAGAGSRAADTQPRINAASGLSQAAARLAAGSEMLQHTSALLSAVDLLAPGTVGAGDLRALEDARAQFAAAASQAGSLAAVRPDGAGPGREALRQFSLTAGKLKLAAAGLLPRIGGQTLPAVEAGLQQLSGSAQTAAAALQQAPRRLESLDTVLAEAGKIILSGQEALAALQQYLPAVRSEVHAAAGGISDPMAAFGSFVTDGLPRILDTLPAAGSAIHEAAEFARKDLPAAEQRFRSAAELIRTGLPQARQGVERAAGLVREDLPALENAVRKAADTVRRVKEDVNLDEIAQLLGGDIKSESDFLANPVILAEHQLYPIPNYGSAMTPFYVVLSLWVGGTLLVSLLRTGVDTGGRRYRGHELYFGRLFTFLTVGILQALVAALGNLFILNCYVADKGWFVLFAALISIVFVTTIFTLVAVFGNIGKGIAIVFMILQFSSSGGTFPISTTAHVFQALNPFMPFTYAISLLREAVGGILPEVAVRDALFLILFGLLALLLALLLQKPLAPFIRKSAEQAEKSKLIS
ncbi:YhgE/Pip domain-containing protein [Paenibacillus sp. MMS20-IR301]|uniref:YhgE/Pip domain-containing protein n=1 Tax=Paenibacillus sp. MMS20-IR301 TaxID=2895946 RepID=UPI0028EBCF62|nr:YhgE/Pip domain-containing protein [Paenibacillus sp. MMS20-IR301]WNS42919.1 YhgE/Pip domain-containing protein [Paenibacillus sp. MMS20-IR301]